MNVNTYQRHGVFDDREACHVVAARLASADDLRKAKVFPYQTALGRSRGRFAVSREGDSTASSAYPFDSPAVRCARTLKRSSGFGGSKYGVTAWNMSSLTWPQ